jgi:hypothetical protein
MEAAEAIAPTAATKRRRVLEYIADCGYYGATEEEIDAALMMRGNTCRPRIWELMKTGQVVDSGRRRMTLSNRRARVVVVPEWY